MANLLNNNFNDNGTNQVTNNLTYKAQDITNLLSQYETQLSYNDYKMINDTLFDISLILQSYNSTSDDEFYDNTSEDEFYDNTSEDELYDRAMNSAGCGCGGGSGGGGGGNNQRLRMGHR